MIMSKETNAKRKQTAKATPAKKTGQSKARKATAKANVSKAKRTNTTAKKPTTARKVEKKMTQAQNKVQFDKIAKEAASAGQEQVDVLVKSSTIFAKGCEDFVKTYVSIAQESAEKNSEALKTLLGCKSLNEFTETQQKLAQTSFDEFVSSATKLSELSVKVATDAFEPINDQVSKSIKKVTETIAA
jgi:phasin family protein